MLNTANLSLDQAPPISIPFRFFLTAPLFGIAAGLLLLVYGPDLLITRWSPPTLALTHLVTLGMLAMVMCGALTQMLPVLAGSPLPRVVAVGRFVHVALTIGTVLLVLSFFGARGPLPLLALLLLGSGFLVFVTAVSIALIRVKHPTMTIRGMQLAIAGLLIAVVLGTLAASGIFGIASFGERMQLVEAHLNWGLAGFMGLLLIAVSYQVVPMFQVTPEYPALARRWLVPGLFSLLIGWSLLLIPSADLSAIRGAIALLIYVGFALFAIATLRLQRLRKRRIPDVTLMFWRVGMAAILVSLFLWSSAQLIPALAVAPWYPLLLGMLLLMGVGVAVVNGMLYKIVPFLSWFHLQNRQMSMMNLAVQIPNMKQLIPDRAAKRQMWAYYAALAVGLAAVFWPSVLARLAGLLFILSNLMLAANLLLAIKRYRDTAAALVAAPSDAAM